MKFDKQVVLEQLKLRGITLIGTLENYRTRKPFQCSKGHQWDCTAYDIIERQHTCSQCGWDTPLTNAIIDERVDKLNTIRKTEDGMRKREAIKRIGDYKTHKAKIEWECLVDKHRWLSTPHDILFRGVGCPLCHVKSETIVYLAIHDKLKSLGIQIDVVRQKELTNYQYDGKERTAYGDFWFQLKGKTYLIEYNGEQHYKLVFFGSTMNQAQAEAKLKKQQFRDNVVVDYCSNNKIDLFVIDGRKISGEKKVKAYIDNLFDKEIK